MIKVRSTINCPNTPRVLFALEALDLAYETELAEDGEFTAAWGSPGPSVRDGDAVVVEWGAIARHLVRRSGGRMWPTTLALQADADRWFEFQGRRLGGALERKDQDAVMRLLGFVDKQAAKHAWFLGDELTMVDCMWSLLTLPHSRKLMPLSSFDALSAYLERLSAHPALERAQSRLQR